ncbi:MAG: lipid-A-disaccharide synthase, partial [Spirulinaceae cyanobacterium RM2_2_10]|nr:lipid-A-disaccharide synthase [Spirulinaceae cyanobacterium RM2_2_10]
MQVFISTGEVSGDLQGALLVSALHHQAAAQGIDLEVVALGGDRMAAAGARLLANTTSIGAMGLIESLPFVWPTWRAQTRAKQHLRANPPDVMVLLDYIGPNLVLGRYARRQYSDLPIAYYIAPQMWVWSPWPGQTRRLVEMTDRIIAIFPGEASYFKTYDVEVEWVGHPLLDRV